MRIVILGAGLSGLAAAYRLSQQQPRATLTVLEARSHPGGNIRTTLHDGFLVEHGPNGLFDAKPHALQLVHDIGLGGQLLPGSEEARKNRFLFVKNQLHALPAGPLGILSTPILSPLARLRLFTEPLRPRRHRKSRTEETVAEFARRRFGPEVANTFIDGLVTGIHGGDPEQLSLPAAFPRLFQMEQSHGSIVRGMMASVKKRRENQLARGLTPGPQRLWSFPGGLQTLTDRLAEHLGPRLRLNAPAHRLQYDGQEWTITFGNEEKLLADQVVLTIPAHEQAELLATLDAPLAERLRAIESCPIAVVALGYRRGDVQGPQDGFGYLAPQRQRRDCLGVQWCSSVYPGRAPAGMVLWRALCGGVHRAELINLSEDDLIARVHTEMTMTMQVRGAPVFTKVIRWPRAIPQYNRGHGARVAAIQAQAAHYPGLILAGTAYRGIALNDCCEQAELLSESLQGTSPARVGPSALT
ncbi:MAG: protoporphyrinogen oxidase [Gemmataceae bacterium]